MIHRQKRPVLTTKNTDWDKFRNELNQRITATVQLKTTADLDKQTQEIVKNIQEVAKASIIAETEENCKLLIVRNLIKKRRQAKRVWY